MKQQVQLMGLHKEFQAVFYLKQCLLLQLCLGLNPFFFNSIFAILPRFHVADTLS